MVCTPKFASWRSDLVFPTGLRWSRGEVWSLLEPPPKLGIARSNPARLTPRSISNINELRTSRPPLFVAILWPEGAGAWRGQVWLPS
jgi:hypothetical protein